MPLQSRNTLKNFFRKGQMPSEGHFIDLIESMLNKVDDGMSKTIDDGLMLSPIGVSKKLMSFFKRIEDKNPAWSLEIDSGNANMSINNHQGESIFTLQNDGKIGINNPQPQYELDVNGFAGLKGRKGTYEQGKIPADGKWHKLFAEELKGCNALEIVAGVGKQRTGKYALIHAFALSTFGKSRSKIHLHQGYYGVRCNKLELRWVGDTYNYNIEMRTRCSYGGEIFIKYYISSLWDDHSMNESV